MTLGFNAHKYAIISVCKKYGLQKIKKIYEEDSCFYGQKRFLVVFENGEKKIVGSKPWGYTPPSGWSVTEFLKEQLMRELPYNDRKYREIFN